MHTLLAWTLSGALAGPGVELAWRAPPGCPDVAEARAELERFLGGRPGGEAVAEVDLVEEDAGFVATVSVAGFAARTLRAGDCQALTRAAALVIAVAVDPLALADSSAPSPAPPVVPPREGPAGAATALSSPPLSPRAEPSSTRERRPAPADARAQPPISHALGLRGGALYGVAGRIAGALAVAYDLDRGPLRFELRGLYGGPRRVDYPDGVGVRTWSLGFAALLCLAHAYRWLRAPICGGIEAGSAFGAGLGAAEVWRRASPWASALVGIGLVARVRSRVAVTLGGELGIALLRPAFHVGDRAVLVRAPPVGGRILLGLEFRVQ